MAETHLDHPGDVTWFKGYGPAEVVGPCPHDCPHTFGPAVIAWGPDFEHYSLVECRHEGGCEGSCRAWTVEYPPPFSEERPKFRLGEFRQVRRG